MSHVTNRETCIPATKLQGWAGFSGTKDFQGLTSLSSAGKADMYIILNMYLCHSFYSFMIEQDTVIKVQV